MKTRIDLRRFFKPVRFASISLVALGLVILARVDLRLALEHAQANQTSGNAPSLPQLAEKCAQRSSCGSRPATSRRDIGLDRPACHCDRSCVLYDDCCRDSRWAEPTSGRVQLGAARLRARRREWLCRRVDPTLPGIYLRANCHPEWAERQRDGSQAELVRQRCEMASAPADAVGKTNSSWLHSDPLGSLMPITDFTAGVTYANSYCLRCNSLRASPTRQKLIYWSPVVSCNYNIDSDDRNALYDLISSKGGRALAYSKRHNRWFVKMNETASDTSSREAASESEADDEILSSRVCTVSPKLPDSAMGTVRHCRPRTKDSCPVPSRPSDATSESAVALLKHQQECQFGHQALVYSQTRDLAYYNLGCAMCNLDPQVACEPRLGKQLEPGGGPAKSPTNNQPNLQIRVQTITRFQGFQAPPDPIELPDDQLDDDIATNARNQGGLQPYGEMVPGESPVSGSFSVLMDLYGGLQGDSEEQVGSVHRCEDTERQVYDPFLLTCRDIVCGLSYRFEDGVCVPLAENGSAKNLSADLRAPASDSQPKPPLELEGVNGTAAEDKRPPSSSGQQASGQLIARPAEVQEETPGSAKSGGGDKQGAQDASAMPAGLSLVSSDGNPFFGFFAELRASRTPQASDTRKSLAGCGKILIQPEHYRLFNASELESASVERLATRPNPAVWDHKVHHAAWAVVAPYNLTLAPGQFQPVRAAGRPQLGLLVCSPFKSDLVDKFKPAMVYLTTCCLVVSITSLVLYLLLYCLSTYDLRHLVVELTQAGQMKQSLCKNALNSPFRDSRASNETSYNAVRSQSLSSRGVACLAAALLAAYLLFVLGHHHQAAAGGLSSCAIIAAATYGSFLLAFNWMFLLSYDIWRTLRLATCQLRAPTMGSQTSRFLIYATVAAVAAFSMAALALLTDSGLGLAPECPAQVGTRQGEPPGEANCTRPSLQPDLFEQFVLTYRPKFGHRAGSCWFSNRRSLALFFGLPVTLIMLVNLLFFLHSSFMVIKTASRSSRRLKPTNSSWSQSSDQSHDFAQQNSLTTSSISSVQTIQSNISARSGDASDQEPDANNQLSPLESADHIQGQIVESAKQLNEKQRAENKHPPLAQTKQSSFSGSFASASQISFTDQLMASSLVHKCDLHLSTLGALVGSLAKDYRLYCRLSTIMGLTWLTGLAASLVDQSDALWYLFVVLNSLQGLFIFVAFGLKRSRLTNVKILFVYINQMLKQKLFQSRKQHPNQAEA